jgi:hypothetical protein
MTAFVVTFAAGALAGAVSLHGFGAWYLHRHHGLTPDDVAEAINRARR